MPKPTTAFLWSSRNRFITAPFQGREEGCFLLLNIFSQKSLRKGNKKGGERLCRSPPDALLGQQGLELLPGGPGEEPGGGQGLLKSVAVGAHLHQEGTLGELLVEPVGPDGDGPGQGG